MAKQRRELFIFRSDDGRIAASEELTEWDDKEGEWRENGDELPRFPYRSDEEWLALAKANPPTAKQMEEAGQSGRLLIGFVVTPIPDEADDLDEDDLDDEEEPTDGTM
jgi:hypothetical protein